MTTTEHLEKLVNRYESETGDYAYDELSNRYNPSFVLWLSALLISFT